MSKRQGQALCDRTGKRSRPPVHKKKHLYLVFDDWEKGFSIYKIDADTLDASTGLALDPAILRFAAPVPGRSMGFGALGSNNIFIAPNPCCGDTATLVYDTETGGLSIGPRLPDPLVPIDTFFVSAPDVLYGLTHNFESEQHSFEVMSWAPTGNKDPMSPTPTMDWSWKSVPSPPPFTWKECIASYALHPDGRTIFLSAHTKCGLPRDVRTFSFDTRHCEWRSHGEWALPFQGQGYFDGELDAWVGLHKDGYVCVCRVASRSSTSGMQPEWKMAKDNKLFREAPERRRAALRGPTLTYMGNSRFCIVECVIREGVEFEDAFGDCDGCVLHMSTFGLKYSHKGELQTTIHSTTNSYLVSKQNLSFSPVAFWM